MTSHDDGDERVMKSILINYLLNRLSDRLAKRMNQPGTAERGAA